MVTSDVGAPEKASTQSEELVGDLASLAPQALREKYRKEATSHRNMKRRCQKGRSRVLDPAWDDFRPFLRDMGPVPSPEHTIDRLDTALQRYGPGLVQWADKTTQTKNRVNTVWVDFRGQRLTASEFAKQIGRPYKTVYAALARGESPEQIAGPRPPRAGAVWQHPFPDRAPAFDRGYADWRPRLQHGYKHLASPEVFYLLVCYRSYSHLSKRDWEFDTPEEANANEDYQGYLRCYHGIQNTLDFLRDNRPGLAEELTPRNQYHRQRLANLITEAITPPVRDR